jgi:hypothetical protein
MFATMYQNTRFQIQEYHDSEIYEPIKTSDFLIFTSSSPNIGSSLDVFIYFLASNVSAIEVRDKEWGNSNLVR